MTDITLDDTRLAAIAHARELLPVAASARALIEYLGHELYRLEGLASDLADEPDDLAGRYHAIAHSTGLGELRDALDRIQHAIDHANP